MSRKTGDRCCEELGLGRFSGRYLLCNPRAWLTAALTSGATLLLSLSGHFDEYIFERFKEKSESLHEREGLGRGVGVGSEGGK